MSLKRLFSPTFLVGLLVLGYLAVVWVSNERNPLTYAQVGAGFVNGQPVDEENTGYDGQFFYYMALDPTPARVAPYLDIPAYRYQRILYPLVARGLALAQPAFIPWMLVMVNWAALVASVGLLESWLVAEGASRWYALTYGLWCGLVAAVRLDLAEPLCYGLVVAAWLAQQRKRQGWAIVLLGLALFAKETAMLFLAASGLAALCERRWAHAAYHLGPLGLYALFQGWLYLSFGAVGLGSGGYLGTPFEVIPYMGLWRIALVSWPAFALFLLLMGLPVVLPSVWGLVAAARRLWQRDYAPTVWALALNAAVVPFAPYSTFREPLGMFRFICGLVLATVFFGVRVKSARVLNYSLFWLAALIVLVRE